jgi:hypothetical protein
MARFHRCSAGTPSRQAELRLLSLRLRLQDLLLLGDSVAVRSLRQMNINDANATMMILWKTAQISRNA